jgi:hypothetical protein
MNEDMSDLPQAIAADPDGVQVALRAAHTLWSRGDTAESLKWLRKAAETASDEGADIRSLQLAKAAAELRAKLVGGSEPPARQAQAGSSFVGSSAGPSSAGSFSAGSFSAAIGSVTPQGAGSFPPSDVAPGESGSHPIAPSRARPESEPPRAGSFSSAPPIEAFVAGSAEEDGAGAMSSRPVTATQYPSHRPRQRMGLLSASPASTRDGAAYASVPSWSADSERRGSVAPPPLPSASLDDYEELEAEPDDEPADDPGSVWSSEGPESWHPAEAQASSDDAAPYDAAREAAVPGHTVPGAMPPPLPPRGAFSDDDGDFTQQSEAQTVVIPPLEENGDAEPRSARDSRRAAADFGAQGFAVQGNAWDQQSRIPSWGQDTGSSWAGEVHQSALHQSPWGGATNSDGSVGPEALAPEAALQSETTRAKLTARVHHQAVRVSFAPDLRVPGQYVVRPLREGEKAGTGERVALLVALEPGVPLV